MPQLSDLNPPLHRLLRYRPLAMCQVPFQLHPLPKKRQTGADLVNPLRRRKILGQIDHPQCWFGLQQAPKRTDLISHQTFGPWTAAIFKKRRAMLREHRLICQIDPHPPHRRQWSSETRFLALANSTPQGEESLWPPLPPSQDFPHLRLGLYRGIHLFLLACNHRSSPQVRAHISSDQELLHEDRTREASHGLDLTLAGPRLSRMLCPRKKWRNTIICLLWMTECS